MSFPEMTRPDTSNFADEVYEHQHMFHAEDAANGYGLLLLTDAFGAAFEDVDRIVRDDPELGVGWSSVFDPDRCPIDQLGYLAQFVGVRLLPGLPEATQRERVKSTDGFRRGTPAAMIGAAQQFLTGAKTVLLRERYDPNNPDTDSPYHFQITTYTDQTPNHAAVEEAVRSQKPAGLIMHYRVAAGQDWQALEDSGSSWQQVMDAYPDWDSVANDIAGD